jgi:hypothetical protein
MSAFGVGAVTAAARQWWRHHQGRRGRRQGRRTVVDVVLVLVELVVELVVVLVGSGGEVG